METMLEFEQALSHFKKGEIETSKQLCQELLAQDPNDGEALNLMGAIAIRGKDFEKGIELIKSAINHRSDKAHIYMYNLALAYLGIDNLPAAIETFQKSGDGYLRAKKEEDAIYCYQMAANGLRKTGDLLRTKMLYSKILSIDPDHFVTQNDLGLLLYLEKDFKNAARCFQNAIDANPNFASSYNHLGVIYLAEERWEEAQEQLELSHALDPNCIETLINLGAAYFRQQKFDLAEQSLALALEGNPEHPGAHNNMGIALHMQGKLDQAIGHYKKALELAPHYEEVQRHLDEALDQLQQISKDI